jgi:nucleoside-diphosphate-sugar epimerase
MTYRILITGSNGFLGRSFIRLFTAPNCELVPLSGRSGVGLSGQSSLDLTNRKNLQAVLREVHPTHVLNFASKGVTRDKSTLEDLLAVNTIGAVNLVEALITQGLTPQIYCFGTAYEYADSNRRLDESAALDPKSPYAISKTTLHYALRQFGDGASLTFLRLFNVFGPGEPADRLIPFIARKARAREPIPLTSGQQQRDFMFIDDLIAVLGRLVTGEPAAAGLRTLNVGTGKGVELKSFISSVRDSLRRRGLEPEIRLGDLPYRTQDPMRCVADNARLTSLLGEFRFTDLNTAVNKAVEALNEY